MTGQGRREPFHAAAAVLALCLPCALAPGAAGQEPGTVRGRVSHAATGRPLSAVQVFIPGGRLGTLTDERGRFTLQVPPGRLVLRARRIGYRPEARTITLQRGGSATVEFDLQPTALDLDEIVVTGTAGERFRRAVGNAVSTVEAEEAMERGTVREVGDLLKSRIAGLSVSPSTGQVGSGPAVRARGASTFSLFDHPLVYVDGVRVDNAVGKGISVQFFGSGIITSLNELDPDDIERIEVIKGPAAATLYGTEASNGVVQIITKRGRAAERADVRLRIAQGANWFRNAAGRIDPNWGLHPKTGEPFSLDLFEREAALGNEIFRTGHNQEYGLSVRGGSELLRYYVSGGLDRHEGIEPTNDLRRLGVRANTGIRPQDRWAVDVGVGLIEARRHLACEAGCVGVMSSTMFSNPSSIDTPYRGFRRGPPEFHRKWRTFPHTSRKLTGSLQVEWTPLEWITQRLVVGQDLSGEKAERIVERQTDPFIRQFITEEAARGSKFVQRRDHTTTTADYSGTVEARATPSLASRTSVGIQYYRERTEFITAAGRGFPVPDITVTAAAAETEVGEDDFVENRTLGLYVQEQLAWRDRIFVTGAVRVDDNSAFGSDLDLVAYPKVSVSWVVHEEPFLDVRWIEALRLRAAYGQAGQQPEAFAALRTYAPVTSGRGETAVTPQSVGNRALAPERGTELEMGLDADLFGGRLGLDVTYYDASTRDAILARSLPPSAGFPGVQFVNAGKIASRGVELALNALPVQRRNVDVELNLSLNTIDNEVIDLGGVDDGAGFISAGLIRFVPGLPVGSWFAPVTVSAELDENGRAVNVLCDSGDPRGPALPDGTPLLPGGRPTGCEDAPLLFVGRSTPSFEGSFSATVRLFGSLRLYGLMDWQVGWRKFDISVLLRCQVFRVCEENFFPERFDPARVAEFQSSATLFNVGLGDASFAKLREISVRWDLSRAAMDALGIGLRSASLTVAGRELFPPITSWPGLDPEVEFHGFGFARAAHAHTPPLAELTATLKVGL